MNDFDEMLIKIRYLSEEINYHCRIVQDLKYDINKFKKENEILIETLKEIAHHKEYDGRFCPDPEDCSSCIARNVLNKLGK